MYVMICVCACVKEINTPITSNAKKKWHGQVNESLGKNRKSFFFILLSESGWPVDDLTADELRLCRIYIHPQTVISNTLCVPCIVKYNQINIILQIKNSNSFICMRPFPVCKLRLSQKNELTHTDHNRIILFFILLFFFFEMQSLRQ